MASTGRANIILSFEIMKISPKLGICHGWLLLISITLKVSASATGENSPKIKGRENKKSNIIIYRWHDYVCRESKRIYS